MPAAFAMEPFKISLAYPMYFKSKILLSYLVLCAASLLPPTVHAQQLPATVRDAFKRAAIPIHAAGVVVREVGGNPPLVTSHAGMPLNPASTMKLVTTSAALELLGPAYTWKTQAYTTGQQFGDILQGDLILKGSGDPKLVLENFWLFLREIRLRGIREIRGNLVLDRSLFAERPFDAAQFDGDPSKPYNVGPDALLLNYQTISFRFMPNPVVGVVSIAVDPPLAGYPVVAPRLAAGECTDWQSQLRAAVTTTSADFGGEYPAACGEKIWRFHPYQMPRNRYLELVFRRLWTELGGTFQGDVISGVLPADARLIAQWQSPALTEVIRDINKFSNNVMARQLLLTLAAQLARQPAIAEDGVQVVKSWLAAKQIDAPELVMENGSGLSRTERISAGTLAHLLWTAFRSPTMPEFIASLPLAGQDGTMRQRMKERNGTGNAHIKTGYIKEVRSIAGYVLAASGKRYVVVAFINHPNAISGAEALDTLLQWVYENG